MTHLLYHGFESTVQEVCCRESNKEELFAASWSGIEFDRILKT